MKLTDSPGPAEDPRVPHNNAPSLEQLLSLRPAGAQRITEAEHTPSLSVDHVNDEQADDSDPSPVSEDMHLPLWMIVHERRSCGQCIKSKLHYLGTLARIQWVPIHSAVMEQVLLQQPQVVVIQFINGHLELAARWVAEIQESHPHLTILALGSTAEPQCMLAALRAGVKEFLDIDSSEEELRKGIESQLQKRPAANTSIQIGTSLTAIVSARAGLGASLLAAHLAVFMQQELQGESDSLVARAEAGTKEGGEVLKALLLDLGAPRGDGGLYLDTNSEFDFLEAIQSLRRFDRKLASTGMTKHDSGLRLLSLPRKADLPSEWPHVEADMLLQRLQQYFECIVADLGAVSQADLTIRVALRAARIWVICDQSLASVVSTTELLQLMDAKKVDRSRMGLIISRYDRDLELSAQQIAEQLQLPLLATVPERRLELLQAINQGRLLQPGQRREPYVQAVQKLVQILREGQTADKAAAPRAFGRWLQRIKG